MLKCTQTKTQFDKVLAKSNWNSINPQGLAKQIQHVDATSSNIVESNDVALVLGTMLHDVACCWIDFHQSKVK